jgi:BirA family biotin operon repressor/biotin-[acetyl-CoA-carboxylase] ligase
MRPQETWQLDLRRLGRRVLVFDQLGSTNSYVAGLADENSEDGLVVVAREQTAGRGQHGRSWSAPAGSSVLMSVLLRPPPELRRPAFLIAWAAVSVCETILHLTGLQAKIKWPNDVLIRGKKVCGILTEARGGVAPVAPSVIVGIGLNVNQSAEAFASAGLPDAGSLALFADRELPSEEVTRSLLTHLDEEYDRLCQGDFDTLAACWKWRLGLLGKQVEAELHDRKERGRLLELDWNGVLLEQLGGNSVLLAPESVRHLHERD